MTEQDSKRIVAMIAGAFPTPGWELPTLQIFAEMIGDLDGNATKAAVMDWIKTRADRPTIADIRNAARAQLEQAGAIPAEREADEAWGDVVKAISRVGRYRPFPAPEGSVLAEVVGRMGWETLCLSDNPEADRAHFLQLYRAALGRQRSHRNAAPGLQLASDAERRASLEKPRQAKATLELPSPEERQRVKAALHELAETIGNKPVLRVVPKAERPAPRLQVETPQAIEAADQRRQQLRQQLAQVGQ